jgi:nucleoside-diphosphate-sugar epimerase/N-acetylglutamate synthase-like GNAT family acetyltransferase
MRYFVTGATGFIGGRLVRQLRAAGHDVVALVRTPANAKALTGLGVALHPGDITDKDSLRAGMRGVDGVFHLAAWYRIGARAADRRLADQINVTGTRNVLEAMRDSGVPKGVYTSTLNVFGDTEGWVGDESYRRMGPWLSEYDRSKWAAHYEVAVPMIKAGLPLVIVQPGAVYGPGDPSVVGNLLRQYLRRTLPIRPHGAALCWGHVDDTAHGHILAMDKGRAGESYIIAGPPHTLEEALELAEEITGIRPPLLRPPAVMLRLMARAASAVERVVPLPQSYSSETLRIAAGATYLGSSEKAQQELGFRTRPLEDGLRETLLEEMALLGMKDTRNGIRAATPSDLSAVIGLLEKNTLPLAGINQHVATTLVAQRSARIVGCAALEVFGRAGLLRSVTVDEAQRGQGLGHQLTQAALDLARTRGVASVYLLTTTAASFFPRFGFREVARADVDGAVKGSVEFTTACPASAVAMRVDLRA